MLVVVNFKSGNISCFMNEIYYEKILPFFELVNVKSNLFAKFYDDGVEINEKEEDLMKARFVNTFFSLAVYFGPTINLAVNYFFF